MNLLITGSSGYIARRFIHNFNTQYTFDFFSLQTSSLESIAFTKIDAIVHCAALVHQKALYSQNEYDAINAEYPYQLAKKAKETGVKHFIFISSVAVYQESATINENTQCVPETPYGRSKLKGEELLNSLMDDTFVVSILRSPMVYGPNAPGNIASLLKIVRTLPILPFGEIKNNRTFVGIDNLTALIHTLLQKRSNGIFLAADDTPLSTTRLIQLIAKTLNKKIFLVRIPFFEIFLKSIKPSLYKKLFGNLHVDNTDTKTQLNFHNPYTTEEGIINMIRNETPCC